jgi:Alpha galactosidase C-terminal beta sandwich domain
LNPIESFSLDVAYQTGPNIDVYPCNGGENQMWIWNSTIQTFQSKYSREYLTFRPQLEIWSDPLVNGSQAVVLFNRGNNGSEPITVQWKDIPRPTSCKQDLLSWAFCTQDLGPDLEYRYVNRSYAHLGYRFHSDTVRH